MQRLNKKQTEQAKELLNFYNYYFICNDCGSIYGADGEEAHRRCVTCEARLVEKSRAKNKKKLEKDNLNEDEEELSYEEALEE